MGLAFRCNSQDTYPLNSYSMKSKDKKVSFATNHLKSKGAAQPNEQARLIQYDVVNRCS